MEINDIFHFLWFFGEKTNEYLQTFIKRFNEFENVVGKIRTIICSIYEISKIIENTSDWITTEKGLITIVQQENSIKFKLTDSFEIIYSNNIFSWIENENKWILNIQNIHSSKIIVKNSWKNETKEQFIKIKYGNFICDDFIHNDRYIINISKDFIDNNDCFDVWDIDNNNYIINKKGITEIYPIL